MIPFDQIAGSRFLAASSTNCVRYVVRELELGGLLDGQVGWLGSAANPIHVGGRAPEHVGNVHAISHETPGFDKLPNARAQRHAKRGR
jgi:hypothetical protein